MSNGVERRLNDSHLNTYLQTISLDEETLCAPKIVKKLPQTVQTTEGSITTLEVKVIGKPKPEVKWLRDDEEIIPSDEYQIENKPDGTSVLAIAPDVHFEETGKITFEAYNSVGVAETETELVVEGIFSSQRIHIVLTSFYSIFYSI